MAALANGRRGLSFKRACGPIRRAPCATLQALFMPRGDFPSQETYSRPSLREFGRNNPLPFSPAPSSPDRHLHAGRRWVCAVAGLGTSGSFWKSGRLRR